MVGFLQPTRRMILAAGPALMLASPARPSQPMTVMRCADLLDTIGVNTHLGYAASQYRDLAAIKNALDYIGVRHVRDVVVNWDAPDDAKRHLALAQAGVKFCMFWGPRPRMERAIQRIAALEAACPGAVQALEGPNEIKPDFSYAGLAGNVGAQRFMSDMRAAAGANEHLHRKPLVSLTTYERVAVDCDFANAHPYPKGGSQAAKMVRTVRERQVGSEGIMPGKGIVFTEFGYHTLVGKPIRPGGWQGVTPELQAVLLVNALFDNAAAGIARTYIYQLLDGSPDGPRGPDMENHFGLIAHRERPKPAAEAIRRLTTLLADPGPSARDFATRPFGAQLDAAAPIASLALQNATGRRFLALWNESPVWDPAAAAPRAVALAPVALTLAGPASVKAFDLIDPRGDVDLGTGPVAKLAVGAHPVLLSVGDERRA